MVKRDALIKFIYKTLGKDLLDKAKIKDEMANGVQIAGGEDVELVTLGVSINEEFLKKAIEDKSNFCIVHHGLDPRVYKGKFPTYSQKRMRLVYQNNLTIVGFHYALDAHPTLGNNAQIIKKLGADLKDPLYEEWGYTATFDKPIEMNELVKKCEEAFGRNVHAVCSDNDIIKTIGVVSGAGKPYPMHIAELETKGVEAYISGETSEHIPHKLKESGINYIVCGHYSTEVFGVQALGEKIKKHFGDKLAVEFIDVPNPI